MAQGAAARPACAGARWHLHGDRRRRAHAGHLRVLDRWLWRKLNPPRAYNGSRSTVVSPPPTRTTAFALVGNRLGAWAGRMRRRRGPAVAEPLYLPLVLKAALRRWRSVIWYRRIVST